MRLLICLTLFLLSSPLLGQNSFVYKRNANGELELYQSQGGLPSGSPIIKIKKNVYGYIEIENVKAQINPFTKKPNYDASNIYKPYQLPAKQIFKTIEVLNKRFEFDYILTKQETKEYQSYVSDEELQTFIQNRDNIANAFINFYQTNTTFPKKLKDGWYEVVQIYPSVDAKTDYKYGVCKVISNKPVEYYSNINLFDNKGSFVYRKNKMDLVSSISQCKASFKSADDEKYHSLYFLDNILDSSKQIPNPNFALFSVLTSPNFKVFKNLFIGISIDRNKDITQDELENFSGGIYSEQLFKLNPQELGCDNSYMTLAFKGIENRFSIGIIRYNDKKSWIQNNISLLKGQCQRLLLNEY